MLPILASAGILRQVEPGEHLLVGDARLAVGEMRAVEGEAERVGGRRLRPCPATPWWPRGRRSGGSARRRRGGRPTSGLRVAQVRRSSVSPGPSGACGCVGKSSFFTSRLASRRAPSGARSRASVGKKSSAEMLSSSRRCLCSTREIALGSALAEADAQALHGLDQVLVARRAVEQPPESLALRARRSPRRAGYEPRRRS